MDTGAAHFPKLFDAFYDIDGYTVESLIQGTNCLLKGRSNPEHFKNFDNLRIVARQGLEGLVAICPAEIDKSEDDM